MCETCSRCFATKRSHTNVRVVTVFVTGLKLYQKKTVFDRLRGVDIVIPEEKTYYPLRATFDIETYLEVW